MEEIRSKKGISLVALVITIIVLIILTAAVVMTGINTPKNTEYAIKMYNHSMVQDAVTLYIMTAMLEGAEEGVKDVEEIVPELYDISNKQWTENAIEKLGINLTQEELQAVFTLDNKGVVGWVEGQEPTREETIKAVASIEITKGINKTEYTVGEKVEITGLEVIATYEDGTTENVASKCIYTPSLSQATATAGEKEIEVSYEGKIAAEKITITVEQGVPTLGSLINGAQDYGKTINYSVDADGYQFSDWKIYYEDEENGYVFIVLDIEKGDYYSDLWYYFASRLYEYYDVVDIPAIDQQKYKIFKLGNDGANITSESINETLCSFLVNAFEGFANKEVYTNSNLESYVVGAMGGPTIEMFVAAYKEKTGIDLNLTIVDNGYKVDPVNVEEMEDLDSGVHVVHLLTDGLYVLEDYMYGLASQGYVENTMYVSGQETFGFIPSEFGSNSPARIYPIVCLKSSMPAQLGSTETTDIIIESASVTSVEITRQPTKTIYNAGEYLDLNGLVVTAIYSNGNRKDITGTCMLDIPNEITKTVGTKEITVSYNGIECTDNIEITVNPAVVDSIAITTQATKKQYTVGEMPDMTGLVVTATYTDGKKEVITDGLTFEPTESTQLTGREIGVTISYEGKTTIQPITVRAEVFSQVGNGNYGEAVDYTVTVGDKTYSNWEIYYATNEHIFLISAESVGAIALSPDGDVTAANNSSVYGIMKLGQKGYKLNADYQNSLAVANLINGYSNYANTSGYVDSEGKSYVVGAIGGPTIELVAARANAISPGAISLEIEEIGYEVNGMYIARESTGIPTSSTSIWVTAPLYYEHCVYYANNSQIRDKRYVESAAVCPVVCLKSSIPATFENNKWVLQTNSGT